MELVDGATGRVQVFEELAPTHLRRSGDLDGDGKVDLLMSEEKKSPTLYLSSLAEKGQLIPRAAQAASGPCC